MNKIMKWIDTKKKLLCIIFISVLSLLLIKQVLNLNKILEIDKFPCYDVSSLYYSAEGCNYYTLLNRVAHNEVVKETIFSDSTEYAALAKYYQAAIYYKAYRDKDQSEAEHYLHTMTENERKISTDIMKDELKKLKQILNL